MRYRRVSGAFHLDEKVRTLLTDDGRYAFFYLLTCPGQTSVGAMRTTILALSNELGWRKRRLSVALTPARAAGMVEINEQVGWVCLPNFLRHNPPESPNVARAWATALATLPECPERDALIQRCVAALRTRREAGAFVAAFADAFAKAFGRSLPPMPSPTPSARPSPIPEQEQEVLPGAGAGGTTAPSPPSLHAAVGSPNGNKQDEWPAVPTVVRL